jgi:tRNA threonylcarbamoyladenosine biosynthesis protein TsaE
MAIFISHRPEETAALGERWGREAAHGAVIGLTGDLGAGKTLLVKGFARGLDITAPVLSPTFALVNEYREGRLPLFHLDLFRLETRRQIMDAGLEEYLFQPPGIAVVEWIERWLGDLRSPQGGASAGQCPGLPRWYRQVWIETIGETDRRISYEDFGA